MDLVYERGQVTANDLEEFLPGSPSNSTVRTHLRILETKGQLRHEDVDGRYIYKPKTPVHAAAQSAIKSLLGTFFQGSPTDLVATLINDHEANLSEQEFDELEAMIQAARARKEKP